MVVVRVGMEDGVIVMLDAYEELAQDRSERKRNERDGDCGDGGPEHEGVPLPLPYLADERERMCTGDVEELACRERDGRNVEDAAGNVDEGDDQEQFERVDDMVGQLRSDQVEPKGKRRREAEDGRGAKQRVDADEEADGDAPCNFLGGRTHAEQRKDGQDDAAVGPVVMDGRGGFEVDWAARVHF